MNTFKLRIKTNNQSYNLFVGNSLIKDLLKIFKNNKITFEKCLLVIDKKVPKKYVKEINFLLRKKIKHNYIFNPTEINKSQKTVNILLNILLKNNFSRFTCFRSFVYNKMYFFINHFCNNLIIS